MNPNIIPFFIRWWVTPKLPTEDVFAKHNFVTQWIVHPVKRRLARVYLKYLQKFTNIKVVGITGSAGKTTTKEMLVSILKKEGKVSFTPKNVDSVYSIPNAILKTLPGTKYLVLEMGVEYPGEMDFYTWIAKPDFGVVTNIFPTHTEFLKNIQGVFDEKSKLVCSLSRGGVAILNSGDKMLLSLKDKIASKVIWFESNDNPLIQNANAARAVAKALGVDKKNIDQGLKDYKKPPHRLNVMRHKSGAVILDDCYNSNPWAAMATLRYFESTAKGKKVAVLGDMLELGTLNEESHRQLGREVAKVGFSVVIGVGASTKFLIEEVAKHSKNTEIYLFGSAAESIPTVKRYLTKDTYILIKGSRSIGLDKLIQTIF